MPPTKGHDIHRGTVRALLYAGGFVQRGGRWFAAPQDHIAACMLRAALAETLLPQEKSEQVTEPPAGPEQQRKKVQAIKARLAEVVRILRET